MVEEHTDESVELPRKSKTKKKKEMTALQELGAELMYLKVEQLKKIPMPQELFQAIVDAQQIKAHEAKRRQLQYIGSLMRQVDGESIRQALQQFQQGQTGDIRSFHTVEDWREKLIHGDSVIMEELRARFPDLDPGDLHRLVINARKEMETGKPKGARRALFRTLMDRLKAPETETKDGP